MTTTFKSREEMVRELRSRRQQALAIGYVGVVERIDRELAELMNEHLAASMRRPVRVFTPSEQLEGWRLVVERAEARGDFHAAAEARQKIMELREPSKLKRRGAIPLVRP